MKKSVRWISALLCCAVLSGFSSVMAVARETPEAENLIQNPGFETGTYEGWQAGPDTNALWIKQPTVNGKNAFLHSGNYAGALYPSQTGSTGFGYQDIVLPETGEYEFSAYLMHLIPNENDKHQSIFISGKEAVMTAPKNVWEKLTISFQAYKGTVVRAKFMTRSGGLFVDDASLCMTRRLPNLLNNDSFEQGLTFWRNHGNGSIFSTTEQAVSGSASAYFGYFTAEPLNNYLEQTVPAAAGRAYTFASSIKTLPGLTGVGAFLLLEAKDVNGAVLATAASSALSDSQGKWVVRSVTLLAPAQTVCVSVKIGGLYCTGAFFADDAVLLSS